MGGQKRCPRAPAPAPAGPLGDSPELSPRAWEGSGQGGPRSTTDTRAPLVASEGHEEAADITRGPSGLAAAAAPAAATLHPHEAGLLLQDSAAHDLRQLLRVAPRVGGHLHPGAGQPPEHLLRAAALSKQLRVPPARPAQQTPAERRQRAVGREGAEQDTETRVGGVRKEEQMEEDKETDGKERWTGDTERGRHTDRHPPTERRRSWGPASPDFPDVLLGHLHVDDDGVDLILNQLPHAPRAQLQQAVLLLGGQGCILFLAQRR